MADIELVIKVPEVDYLIFSELSEKEKANELKYYEKMIAYGKPLPKGHGRIGDLDALEKDMIGGIKKGNYEEGYTEYFSINNVDDCVNCVRYADTIIEADKN